MAKKIRVLIVDDSSVVRQALKEILDAHPDIEVMGTAADPYLAAGKIEGEIPDVIILDVEMPRMDGITFLKKIMTQRPIPVVICSTLTAGRSETAIKALEYGAVEIINKPRLGTKQFLHESSIRLCDAVIAASMVSVQKLVASRLVQPKLTADAVLPMSTTRAMVATTEKVVAVGASTGGTEALRIFLEALPPDAPGIVVVQHMPEHFTSAFAKRLDGLCRVTVKEAEHNDTVLRGRALIAPGNKHTLLKRSGARYYIQIKDGPLVCRHRPSVDVLFRSVARYCGKNAVGVIMTGMGDDGARGMKEMKDAGAGLNIAQDEETSIVYGMPREAVKIGAVDTILPLEQIARKVVSFCSDAQRGE